MKILIVDDEKEIRKMLKRHYTFKGFHVETANNGVHALEILDSQRIDIVISDIMMPEMDGIELLRNIRSQYPMIRPIMITGYVTLQNAMAAMRLQAETCIFKPLEDLSELDDAVHLAGNRLKNWQEKFRILKGMKKIPEK